MSSQNLTTDVCIVGGGPAGMILGILLAAHGIDVIVLESHKDFEREYRGEVLMPRFIQMMKQIGLYKHLEKYPHLDLKRFEFFWKEKHLADLNLFDLSKDAPFAWWMPQPVMLNALWDKAKKYPHFHILFGTTVRDLIRQDEKVTGVEAEQHGEKVEIRSKVTVGADGRFSAVRKAGDFVFEYEDYDFDVVWFTVKRPEHYENTVRAFFSSRYRYLVLPKYPDLLQCGLLIGKGEFSKFRDKGIETVKKELLDGHPVIHDFARQLTDFSPFSVLQARVSFVKEWAKDGCLLIGDAAHTCSPAGAIGVSVAVATAIVAAEVLKEAFLKVDFSKHLLDKVQKLREEDVKAIQKLQGGVTNVVFTQYPFLQQLSFIGIFLAARAGLLRRFQRRIAVMKKPLPVTIRLPA